MSDPLPGMLEPHPVDPTLGELLHRVRDGAGRENDRAQRVLLRAIDRDHPAVASGALASWLRFWRAGLRSAFVVRPEEAQQYADLARAALRLDGHLQGADLRTRGPLVAEGDQLMVDQRMDVMGVRLDPGMTVDVGPVSTLSGACLDVAGQAVALTSTDPGWRNLRHAYTEHELAQGHSLADGLTW
jgi:hypothetical protein